MELEACLGKSGLDLAMSPYFVFLCSLLKVMRTGRKWSASYTNTGIAFRLNQVK